MNFASGLYDTEYTGSLWPAKDIVQLPVSVSHMRTIPSKEALKITETNVKLKTMLTTIIIRLMIVAVET
jgi:hypothetical protein